MTHTISDSLSDSETITIGSSLFSVVFWRFGIRGEEVEQAGLKASEDLFGSVEFSGSSSSLEITRSTTSWRDSISSSSRERWTTGRRGAGVSSS